MAAEERVNERPEGCLTFEGADNGIQLVSTNEMKMCVSVLRRLVDGKSTKRSAAKPVAAYHAPDFRELRVAMRPFVEAEMKRRYGGVAPTE